ncbi:zinc finger CCCH domain-containing protein 1-like [Apium graveolens]|uniref:zinc finger CCCH domain-containing protein 1-like n=1 Tax=Apium graveolens TaxID=4045 RepID=UPI003D7AD51C
MGDERKYSSKSWYPTRDDEFDQFLEDVKQVKGHWLMIDELQEKIRIRKLGPEVQLEYDEEDESQIPPECVICMEQFVLPVVTICKHYFCRPCAVQHNYKDTRCFVCGKQTLSRFRNAHKLRERISADQKI